MTSPTTILDHIIETAGTLFYKEGSKSIGVDRIISEAGVAKATMYRYFSGKDALIEACLQRRNDKVMEALRSYLETVEPKGCHQVLAIFDFLHAKALTPDFRGCAFMIAVAENEASEGVRRIAREHKDAVQSLFAELLPCDWPDASRTAAQLNLLYDGAMAQILIQRQPDAALIARSCAELLMASGDLTRSARAPRRRGA